MRVIKFAPGLIPVLKHQDHDQSTHGSWATGQTGDASTRDLLLQQASQFETFEEFDKAVGLQGLRPRAWHIADTGFELDPNFKPMSRTGGTSDEAGLFVGDPETWQDYAAGRSTVIEYDVSNLSFTAKPLADTSADFFSDQSGNQGFFIRPSAFSRLREVRRMPIEEALSRAKQQQDAMPKSEAEARQIWEESRSVKKHQQHDQSTHGNWAGETVSNVQYTLVPKDEIYRRDVVKQETLRADITIKNETFKLLQTNEKYDDGVVIMNLSVKDNNGNTIAQMGTSSQFITNNEYAKITGIEVATQHQRKGIATTMLTFAREHAIDGTKIEHDTSRLSAEGKAWADVVKHQEHDQSSHGNWAEGSEGSSSELSNDSIRDIISGSDTVNEMYQKVAERLGKNMKPKLEDLSDEEINFFRGVTDVNIQAQSLLDGEIRFTPFQTWGQGIYISSEPEYAQTYGELIGLKLDKSAKLVEGEIAWAKAYSLFDKETSLDMPKILDRITSGKMDNFSDSDIANIYWAAKGYDGYSVYKYGRAEVVLFNADKLTVNKKDIGEAVRKHQQHDQSSHGNWADGMGAGVADSILARVRENGGLSVNMVDGSEPTSGYMVAKGAQFGSIVSADDFYDPIKGPKALADYFKKHKKELGAGKNYLGVWHNKDDGQVYLDVSENIQDRERAISAGQKQDQISIWDVTNFAEIETGGTGSVEKTGSGRDTKEHRGDDRFGDRSLRSENLGEVGKAYKVIRFEPGLIPVLKHGEHDQSTHGSWADGYTDEEISRMEELEDVGPSIQDLEDVLSGEELEPGFDDLKMMVENEYDLYNQALVGIDGRVAARLERLQEEFPNHEYTEQEKSTIYEDVQEEMITEFIENSGPGELAGLWLDQSGRGGLVDPATLTPSFKELYDMSHEVRNAQGEVVTVMKSQVLETALTYDTPNGDLGIAVTGRIEDSDRNYAGDFVRIFSKEEDVWIVEHKILRLQEDYENLGFGKDFIQKSMDWYAQRGMGAVIVGTAWDGARHWARAGFDFNPQQIDNDLNELVDAMVNYEEFDVGKPARLQFDSIMRRATNGYVSDEGGVAFDSIKDMTSKDFPLPKDFAMIGFESKTSTPYVHPITKDNKNAVSWAGERLLSGRNLNYIQILTPEGRNLLQGPIDRDGDGMVFDGTARERPASTVDS